MINEKSYLLRDLPSSRSLILCRRVGRVLRVGTATMLSTSVSALISEWSSAFWRLPSTAPTDGSWVGKPADGSGRTAELPWTALIEDDGPWDGKREVGNGRLAELSWAASRADGSWRLIVDEGMRAHS